MRSGCELPVSLRRQKLGSPSARGKKRPFRYRDANILKTVLGTIDWLQLIKLGIARDPCLAKSVPCLGVYGTPSTRLAPPDSSFSLDVR